MKRGIVFLLFALCCISIFAQDKKETKKQDKEKNGSVSLLIFSPYAGSSSVKFEPVATLITSNGDSLQGKGSTAYFKKVPAGKATVWVEAEGFIPVCDSLNVIAGKEKQLVLNVTDRVVDLQMITIEGSVPALVIKKDTLKFTPDGMNFADDDAAREVLRRMPGVEISGGQIKIGGKSVMKTYVDGRTSLFGDNPMTAIDHIKATDVAHIYAYDEDANPEESNENKKGEKQRVINIETKSKMLNSYDGVLFGGVGPTLGETMNNNQLRYAGGGSFNFFSDEWLLKIDAMQNNQNSSSTSPSHYFTTSSPGATYSENSVLGLSLERKWLGKTKGKDTKISGDYSFNRIAPESRSFSETTYIPTQSYTERLYTSENIVTSQNNTHKANLKFKSNTDKWGRISAEYNLSANRFRNNNQSTDVDITDGRKVEDVMRSNSHQTTREQAAKASLYKNLSSKWSTNISASYTNSNDEETQDRFTSLANSVSELYIPIDNDGGKWQSSIRIDFDSSRYEVDEEGARDFKRNIHIGAYYNISKDRRNMSRVAEDLATGLIDKANTYSFQNDVLDNELGMEFAFRTSKLSYGLDLGVKHATITDERKDIMATNYDHSYTMPKVTFSLSQVGMNGIHLYYTLRGALPEAPQIRNIVNDTNPLYLQAGNPDLKNSLSHNVNLMYTNWKGGYTGRALIMSLNASLVDDYIMSKTSYFGTDHYIPELNYTAKAGSSLSTYANASNYRNISLTTSWRQPLTELKSGINLTLAADVSHTPYFYNVYDAINSRDISGAIQLYTDRIKNTYLSVGWDTDYSNARYEQSNNKNEIIDNKLIVNANFSKILKVGFLKMNYVRNQSHYITRRSNQTDDLLNIYAGVNLKHGIELSMTAYDLLNKDSGRSWSVTENYTRLSYRENFGRYVSFNLKWNLSKIKSNRNVGGSSVIEGNGIMIVSGWDD